LTSIIYENNRIFAEEAKKIMDNRKDDDGDENNAAGVGEDKMSKADKMQRQASANNLGDRQHLRLR
jgi:hypothetical protein